MDDLIRNAPMLDATSYSEHQQVLGVVKHIVYEIINPKPEHRKVHWKNVRMLITDLWLAAKASNNPWRSLSRDKNSYSEGTRYDQIYITFPLVEVVDRLIEHGYIEQWNGKYNKETGEGWCSRIRATDTLLKLIKVRDIYSVSSINPFIVRETVILHDENKERMDYKDSGRTNEIREGLRLTNQLLESVRIEVPKAALVRDGYVLRTDKWVYRVFNNGQFVDGGRICGGVWQAVKSNDRKRITIDGEKVTELDFKANHPSMLYRMFTGAPVPADCYAVSGYERDLLKYAMMRMINNSSQEAAINSIVFGMKKENQKRERKGKKPLLSLSAVKEPPIFGVMEPLASAVFGARTGG